MTRRFVASNGTGVPSPRRTNSCTALAPSAAGIASSCSEMEIIHDGREESAFQSPPVFARITVGSTPSMIALNDAQSRTARAGRCESSRVQRKNSCAGMRQSATAMSSPASHVGPSRSAGASRGIAMRSSTSIAVAIAASRARGKASAGIALQRSAQPTSSSIGNPKRLGPVASKLHQWNRIAAACTGNSETMHHANAKRMPARARRVGGRQSQSAIVVATGT